MFVNFRISATLIVLLLARSRAPNMDPIVDQCRLALRAEPQRSLHSLALRGREVGPFAP